MLGQLRRVQNGYKIRVSSGNTARPLHGSLLLPCGRMPSEVRPQPQRRDRQHTPKQQVQQRYDQAAASFHPNPKKPTLRSRTQLRRAAWGARDGITYPTGSRSALHCRVKADPLAERRAVDLKCVTALGPNPHVDESDAPTLARVQPSSPRAEGFWFPPLSPATRRQAQLPLRPDPSAEADPVRAVQLPTANENRAVVGRFTHPDSLGTSPPALLERAVPLRWEEVQDARDRRKGDVHRAGAEPRLGRDPRKLGRP